MRVSSAVGEVPGGPGRDAWSVSLVSSPPRWQLVLGATDLTPRQQPWSGLGHSGMWTLVFPGQALSGLSFSLPGIEAAPGGPQPWL